MRSVRRDRSAGKLVRGVLSILALGTAAVSVAGGSIAAPRNGAPEATHENWPNVGGDRGGARYSALDQINRGNVGQLRAAWTYHTAELDPKRKTTIECTPVVV